tara:strand:- start:441 stop:1532 length:1092 start_codon:yes stop_codon:yes gene_type:complete
MKITIIIPLAGNRTFKMDQGTGSAFPKILNELNGKLLLERAAQPLLGLPFEIEVKVVVPEAQVRQYNLDRVLSALDERIEVIPIDGETQGATCTTLLSIDNVALDSKVIVTSFEQIIDVRLEPLINEFIDKEAECGVLTFDSIHPRFSYVMIDDVNNVLQAAEKRPISRHAVAGLYYFSSANEFFEAAKNTILNGSLESGYYLSNTINEYILKGKKVVAVEIPKNKYFHFFDSHNVEQYETSITSQRMNVSLLMLTRKYIAAFDSKNLDAIKEFLSPEFCLTDPAVKLKGVKDTLEYLNNLFKESPGLSFKERNIFVDGKTSIIEFELIIDGKLHVGTDVISWDNNEKMLSMDAYLYEVNRGN